ncbi:oxidoreductase [Fusarium avenaceum]|nr:oxidoreductase [Fusarium avenaceum]
MSSTDAAAPWHAAYPSPLCETPAAMTRQEVLSMIKDSNNIPGKKYVLIDLRRTDHEVAYTFLMCASSRGRGPRAAGWFQDYINKRGDDSIESVILSEGISGWAKAGGEFVEWMDEYDGAVWDNK